jgi:ABC-2 type transport system ATP-binding protein/lipopolysaccharide transport system ATP-binding protein
MAKIQVNGVSVQFPIYDADTRSIKSHLMSISTGGRIGRDAGNRICVEALDDVTLAIEHGDRVGLIGNNGAGKTTLLRVLAGIYEPTRGTVEVEGCVAPLFNVGLGIDPEATGFENIYLRGAFLGLSRQEIRARIDEIAEFTELGDYLAMPVRTYSAGMQVRLAFAVSTAIEPEILLMDEWIGAGDATFIAKAEQRINGVVDKARILVIASHSEALIMRTCTKGVLMHAGRVVAVGAIDEVLREHQKFGLAN